MATEERMRPLRELTSRGAYVPGHIRPLGHIRFGMRSHTAAEADGVPWGTRTLDLLLRRQLLYPAELKAHEASDGNRTHITSLEGWNSTTELHSRYSGSDSTYRTDIIIPQNPGFVKGFSEFFPCPPDSLSPARSAPSRRSWPIPRGKTAKNPALRAAKRGGSVDIRAVFC